jgi:hypothetical protein
VGGYATVYAEAVPADIDAYPHVYYGGAYAYLVGDDWYYPTGGGWVVLRGEPPELYQYRARYYAARPYYGGRYYRGYNVAPPAPVAPQYAYPPPATRVR